MSRPWLVYLLVALAAGGAGVAITGLPSSGATDVPAPIDLVADSVAPTTQPVIAESVATTAPLDPTSTTSPVPPSSTSTSTSTSSTTTAPPTSTTSTTVAPSTTIDEPTESTVAPPPDAREARIAIANGAGVAGIAGSAADALRAAGYVDVIALDSDPFGDTVVFARDGFEAAAAQVAAELFIPTDTIASLSAAPAFDTDATFDVVIVLGADRRP